MSVRAAEETLVRLRFGALERVPLNRVYRLLVSTWVLGVLVAIASWNVSLQTPAGSLDQSWEGGLYMAAKGGLHFGTQIVFTYGPLGFLRFPILWYQDLAVIAFLYSAALYIALCVSLVWALRRTLNGAVALVLSALMLAAAPEIEVPIALTAVWCLAALSPARPRFASRIVVFGGAFLSAVESLVLFRSGPVILAMCAITILAQDRRWRQLPIFVGLFLVAFAVLWFASGQGLGNFSQFVRNGAQIVSGYSEAMGTAASSGLYLPGSILLSVALVVAAGLSSAPGKARLAAAAVVSVASFALFKEAAVRADTGHAAIFFATAAGIGAAMAFGRRRLLGAIALSGLLIVALTTPRSPYLPLNLNPITHARKAGSEVRGLFNARSRINLSLLGMVLGYRLEPATLNLLRGHSVHVDPWEAAVIWAYKLRWDPLPVFQDYSAYTAGLDGLNSAALSSPQGPQRILRENTALVDSQYSTPTIDMRFPAWDPPEKSIAMLCNYVALQTTARWQVLGKVPDRCGVPKLVESLNARTGETVQLPAAPAHRLLYAKLTGVGVSGSERLRALLYKARSRFLVVNGMQTYRLVPGTAADGLLMDAGTNADYPAPFALSPAARTIQIFGSAGTLGVHVYSIAVR